MSVDVGTGPVDLVVTKLGEVVVAFDATRVAEVKAGSHLEDEPDRAPSVVDLAALVGLTNASESLPHQGRRVLRVSCRSGDGTDVGDASDHSELDLWVGPSVRIVRFPHDAHYSLPPFLANLRHTVGVKTLVRYGDEVAIFIDIDALLERKARSLRP